MGQGRLPKFKWTKWSWSRPENLYFLTAILLGCCFLFLTPPFQVPDENTHFFRANQIAGGAVFDTQARIPQSVLDFNRGVDAFDLHFHTDRRIPIDFLLAELARPLDRETWTAAAAPTTASYFPVMYLPQVTGVLLGMGLNLSPYKILLLSRLTNLLFGVLLTTLAIKTCPLRKWSMVFIALLPMTLALYASGSPDTFTIAAALFYLSVILKYTVQPGTKQALLPLGLLTLCLVFLKPGYVLLTFLVLLLPNPTGAKGSGWLARAGILLAALLLFFGWIQLSGNFSGDQYSIYPNVDPGGQLKFVLAHPLASLRMFAREALLDFTPSLLQFIGVLGWSDTALPLPVYVGYVLLLLFVLLFDNASPAALTTRSRGFLAVVFLVMALLIYTLFYFVYTPVSAPDVRGYQGRYLLPVAGLLAAALHSPRSRLVFERMQWLLPVWILGGIAALITLVQRFYLPPP